MSATQTTQKWICESCGFIYDPLDGDPDGGIPPGTAFEDIPETWFCPVCGARKRDFVPHEDYVQRPPRRSGAADLPRRRGTGQTVHATVIPRGADAPMSRPRRVLTLLACAAGACALSAPAAVAAHAKASSTARASCSRAAATASASWTRRIA